MIEKYAPVQIKKQMSLLLDDTNCRSSLIFGTTARTVTPSDLRVSTSLYRVIQIIKQNQKA